MPGGAWLSWAGECMMLDLGFVGSSPTRDTDITVKNQ